MKSKGGRAKKATYSTTVMRIPTPLKKEVERLLEDFYSTLNEKPVTGIEVVNIEKPVTGIEVVNIEKPVTSIEMAKDEKPVTGIEILNLPSRCFQILKRLQINTIDDLLALQDIHCNLRHVDGLGKKSLKAIEDALLKYR